MCQYMPNGIKLKIFVKETNSLDPPERPNTNRKYLPVETLTGDKAKKFYTDVLNESSTAEKNLVIKPKIQIKSPKPVQRKKFKNTDLLWMAQNNDVKNLKSFFSQNKDFDINIVDDFGWTPLMCATCGGAEDAVAVLLENGSDPHKCDKVGNTALKLAYQKNQKKIMQMLQNYKNQYNLIGEDETSGEPVESFFCKECKENFTMNKNKHESSTLHLFNSKFKTSTFYGIPESNKGFQLLLQEGWDKEKGLGPDGTGRKFPVKVIMKKDKRGIGAPPDQEKSRLEVQHGEKCMRKRERTYKNWKEKDFEKRFRLEFS